MRAALPDHQLTSTHLKNISMMEEYLSPPDQYNPDYCFSPTDDLNFTASDQCCSSFVLSLFRIVLTSLFPSTSTPKVHSLTSPGYETQTKWKLVFGLFLKKLEKRMLLHLSCLSQAFPYAAPICKSLLHHILYITQMQRHHAYIQYCYKRLSVFTTAYLCYG